MLQFIDGKFFVTKELRHWQICRRVTPVDRFGGRHQIMLPRLRRRRRLADALALPHRAAPSLPPLSHVRATRASPRPRTPRRAAAPRGRDGGERDDGSGDDGPGDGPPGRSLERAGGAQ
jgi:hypothetical protein